MGLAPTPVQACEIEERQLLKFELLMYGLLINGLLIDLPMCRTTKLIPEISHLPFDERLKNSNLTIWELRRY